MLSRAIKKLIPKSLLNLHHLFYAWYGAVKYGHPSEEMLVIGVTGTSGKSSTIFFLRHFLEAAGYTVGALSTIEFCVAGKCVLNDRKMTMLGKMEIQKYLRAMADAGCDVAIIESTSEGALQHRHRFINYDTIALTNLYPEHIEAHGSFEKYKDAKLAIFSYVSRCKHKYRIGKFARVNICDPKDCPDAPFQKVPKTCIVNGNSQFAREFLAFDFFVKGVFARAHEKMHVGKEERKDLDLVVLGNSVSTAADGLRFTAEGHKFFAPMYGEHHIANMLAAAAVARSVDIDWHVLLNAAAGFTGVPGRIEFIPEAEKRGFRVIVDYAFEPVALSALYDVVALLKPKRVIHVCGATGGGRDASRRAPIGKIAGEKADVVIVTNEDPYDEDPAAIIKQVSSGAQEAGKILGENVFEMLDRKKAIQRAVELSREGDLVLVTGKGSEQGMCVAGGKMVEWDDRSVVREALLGKEKIK